MLKRLIGRFKRPKFAVIQEYFFYSALTEQGLPAERIEIDHHSGRCWSSETGWLPMTFPMSLVERVAAISKEKSIDYFFRGVVSPGRDWLHSYSGVEESRFGRRKSTKFTVDHDYYCRLSSARFGLAPVGSCPWSYRFFESILCWSMPVLGSHDHDLYASDFNFLRDGEDHRYDVSKCEENYQMMIDRHTLKNFKC